MDVSPPRRTARNADRRHRAPALDIANTIAAFSEDQAERITHLSKARLRYWAKAGFFQPSFVEEHAALPFGRFYSFKDIVALRTLQILRVRNDIPLRHLRKVAETLAHLEDRLWTATTLFVIDRKVVVVSPETGSAQDVVSGQFEHGIALADVIGDAKADVVRLTRRKAETVGRIAKRRDVAHNTLVVAGTRIPVASVRRLSEDGFTTAQIIAEYPDLSRADVEAALRHGVSTAA